MEYLVGLIILVCFLLAFEYRIRKPDLMIVHETRSGFAERTTAVYPRHFSLAIPRATYSFSLAVEATAKGNLPVRVQLAISVAATPVHLGSLIRMGGWSKDAVGRAGKELEGQLQSYIKQYCEQFAIEELSTQKLLDYLNQKTPASRQTLGIEVVSLTILSFDPTDPQIAEALRQQEQARILERTELLQQQARIAAAKAKLKADEEITLLENDLELKRYAIRRSQLEQESALADLRVDDELRRDRKRLSFDKEELEMLKSSPELLMLTPQAARLAEASQGLKNARTVVSLSPHDLSQNPELFGTFQRLLQSALDSYLRKEKDGTPQS